MAWLKLLLIMVSHYRKIENLKLHNQYHQHNQHNQGLV